MILRSSDNYSSMGRLDFRVSRRTFGGSCEINLHVGAIVSGCTRSLQKALLDLSANRESLQDFGAFYSSKRCKPSKLLEEGEEGLAVTCKLNLTALPYQSIPPAHIVLQATPKLRYGFEILGALALSQPLLWLVGECSCVCVCMSRQFEYWNLTHFYPTS